MQNLNRVYFARVRVLITPVIQVYEEGIRDQHSKARQLYFLVERDSNFYITRNYALQHLNIWKYVQPVKCTVT